MDALDVDDFRFGGANVTGFSLTLSSAAAATTTVVLLVLLD